MINNPASTRAMSMAYSPAGTKPRVVPNLNRASHASSAASGSTHSSYPSSPVKPVRITRTWTPPSSQILLLENARSENEVPVALSSISRDRGPCNAKIPDSSVVSTTSTSRPSLNDLNQSSLGPATRTNESSSSRRIRPSPTTFPSWLHQGV